MYFNSGYLLAVFISFLLAILAIVNGVEIYLGQDFRLPFTFRHIQGKWAKRTGIGLVLVGISGFISLLMTVVF